MVPKKSSLIMMMILVITLACSCTLYKTPRVEDAMYKNFEYEFTFRVPNGWNVQQDFPKALESDLAGHFAKNFCVMLIHPQNNGMIIFQADKSDEDIFSLGYSPDAFKERLTARLQAREQEITEAGELENFTWDIGGLIVKEGYGPTLIYQESASNKNGEQYVLLEYLTQCQKKSTCRITVTLVTKASDLQNNFAVYDKVTDSLKKVYM